MGKNESKIVVNSAGHLSFWPNNKDVPNGWKGVGITSEYEINEDLKKQYERNKIYNYNALNKIRMESNDVCLYRIVEQQAKINYNNIAIYDDEKEVTYEELNKSANQLARYIKSLGIEINDSIGICLNRETNLLIAVLAVHKAGGVYVPLDPSYPKERLQSIIEQSKVKIIVTENTLIDSLLNTKNKVIAIDRDKKDIDSFKDDNLKDGPVLDDVSHIIFTSGSTGMPKGVVMSHSSLLKNISKFTLRLNIVQDDNYLHTASIAFTSALRQFWAPLSVGASIVMAKKEQQTSPISMFEMIRNRNVTIVDTVAPVLKNMVNIFGELKKDRINTLLDNKLRMILSSGGKLLTIVANDFYEIFKNNVQLVNMYGQAETIGGINQYNVPANYISRNDTVELGPPLDGIEIYLLGNDLNPVKNEEVGEICVGGDSVAIGYLENRNETAKKFIPNPFSKRIGDIMYRTGDLGRILPSGNIEYVRRKDLQIKIRGYRIEPEEIEKALIEHKNINDAVIALKTDKKNEKILVAYIIKKDEKEVSIQEIREYLKMHVPEYMIPTHLVFINEFKKLPNGKIDRQALPEIKKDENAQKKHDFKQKDSLASYLSEMWRDILGINDIQEDEQFFELGGTSLLATVFVSRIENDIEEHIPVISLFEAPTISSYSNYLRMNHKDAINRKFEENIRDGFKNSKNRNEARKNRMKYLQQRRRVAIKRKKI